MPMYSNQTLYYLEQLGIEPWIQRARAPTAIFLIVCIPTNLSLLAQNLLSNCMYALDLEKNDYITRECDENQKLELSLECTLTTLVLIFGEHLANCIDERFINKIVVPDLYKLLDDPREKTHLWRKINQIKPVKKTLS